MLCKVPVVKGLTVHGIVEGNYLGHTSTYEIYETLTIIYDTHKGLCIVYFSFRSSKKKHMIPAPTIPPWITHLLLSEPLIKWLAFSHCTHPTWPFLEIYHTMYYPLWVS